MNQTATRIDVYQVVTDRIINLLEQGTIPWTKPWKSAGPPMNLISKRLYKGINVLLLASMGYDQNYFLTFDQIKQCGGSVLKG
jgi:antirestriction protein ArdC